MGHTCVKTLISPPPPPLRAARQVWGDWGTGRVSCPLLWWAMQMFLSMPCVGRTEKRHPGCCCLEGNVQRRWSNETSLDSASGSWRCQFLLAGCVILPSLDFVFLICNVGRSPRSFFQFLPLCLLTIHSEYLHAEHHARSTGPQVCNRQQVLTGRPWRLGPLEKQSRRSNSRQGEWLLWGPQAEMPLVLGGQLNRLIKTRVGELLKGEREMKLARWWGC